MRKQVGGLGRKEYKKSKLRSYSFFNFEHASDEDLRVKKMQLKTDIDELYNEGYGGLVVSIFGGALKAVDFVTEYQYGIDIIEEEQKKRKAARPGVICPGYAGISRRSDDYQMGSWGVKIC